MVRPAMPGRYRSCRWHGCRRRGHRCGSFSGAIPSAAEAPAVDRINTPPRLFQIHSTMRMGQNATDSALDHDAEARWVKRLFAADNSGLSNSLGRPNLTLSTQALTTRTAEKIFQRYFGGTPWVNREALVSSIYAAVTRPVLLRGF